MTALLSRHFVNAVAVACGILAVDALVQAEDTIDFGRRIRPLLSDRCFQCHGPDEAARQGGVRLDQRESAVGEADSGAHPIVPGEPDGSELLRRIKSDDEFERMPPPDSNKEPLTAEQIGLIRRWIEQGAVYDRHWAFVPPQRPKLPHVERTDWPKNSIDRFVLARLEADGIEPAEEAERTNLIRRVSLALTGLPPTPEETASFLADRSPDAYEQVVDRLLASRHYGERMAWPWLDAARYADTSGYQGDPERTMWPWRDWVVAAHTANMPFDQFSIEQLAGDLLPNPAVSQRIATAFNRNHMYNGEGGRIAEETRVENVFDRTETTATVWMGLTFTCARCHTHKFDPILHRDYYSLYDVFNQTSESGRVDRAGKAPPVMAYQPPAMREQLAGLDERISELTGQVTAANPKSDQAQRQWEREQLDRLANAWHVLDPFQFETASNATLEKLDDQSLRATGPVAETDVYTLRAKFNRPNQKIVRLEVLVDDQASPTGSNGRAENGNAVLSEIEIFARPLDDSQAKPARVRIASAKASHAQPGHPITNAINGKQTDGGWATEGFARKENCTATFVAAKSFSGAAETELTVVLHCESRHIGHLLARVRLSVAAEATDTGLPKELVTALKSPPDKRSASQQNQLREYYRRNIAPEYRDLVSELAALEKQRGQVAAPYDSVRVMVMDSIDKRRTTRILEKGIYDKPIGKPIDARVPEFLPPLSAGQELNRLSLARWLVSPGHPLTARVTVNRYWQTLFGAGLVRTAGDFGTQGERPTHPGLLDWLAVEFVASDWNVKQMHKLMVMSATFRQSARVSEELIQRDPGNRLLGRGPRFRLPSWMLRDQALAVSGLLNSRLGGSPVKPYQPAGIWAEATFGKKRYKQDSGDALYRRSLYVFWRRIVGPTMFFDVSNRQTCYVDVTRTNTPLHALTTLNDVTYVEAARALAQRVMQQEPDNAGRLRLAFVKLTARQPTADELSLLTGRLERLSKQFAADPQRAEKLLSVGASPRDKQLDPAQHAAFTAICNMLLNLDEVLSTP